MSHRFRSTGVIEFDPVIMTKKHEKQSSWKRVALVMINCSDFWRYYSWFIKKRYSLELLKPIRDTHLTIINDKIIDHDKFEYGKSIHNKSIVSFEYDINVRTDGTFWWLNVKSEDAEKIRIDCGLKPKPFYNFHITIGYVNGDLRIAHSNYIHNLIVTYGEEYGC